MSLENILCLKNYRVAGNDNCVSYKRVRLQIPPVKNRYLFVRAKVVAHEYSDGSMATYHGKRRVESYDREGRLNNKGGATRTKTRIGESRSFTSASSGKKNPGLISQARAAIKGKFLA